MSVIEVPADAREAVKARRRKEIDELDYRRQLRRLEDAGYTQKQIGTWLGIAQPSVLSALRTAAKVPMPLEGFSGATPDEICQRYAGGLISRAQLVDELTRFPYAKGGKTDGYDSLIVDPPGTWSEVSDAVRRGLIEDDIYEEVFNRRHGNAESTAEKSAAPRKMSARDRALRTAREIASAIGGGEVREKNGKLVIRTKAGDFLVLEHRNAATHAGRNVVKVRGAARMPAGSVAAKSGGRSTLRRDGD